MDEDERKELHKKIQNIVEKYKDKPRLYPKIKEIANRFKDNHPVRYEQYKELAKLTAKIRFDCGFNDRKCKRYSHNEMCCCSGCKDRVGHFRLSFFNSYDTEEYIERELLYYARKFSTKTGFWRKGKGCILPRERRSITCLTYNCSDKLTKEEKLLIEILGRYRNIVGDDDCLPSYISLTIKILKDYFLYRK